MNPTIVLVDKDVSWRSFARDTLENRGFPVKIFGSLLVASRYLERHKADMVLVDFNTMGRGRLRFGGDSRSRRAPRLVVLLSSSRAADVRRCFRAGADDCEDKPLAAEALATIVRQQAIGRAASMR